MRGDGRTFKRGAVWWMAYHLNGREFRESTKERVEDDPEGKRAGKVLRKKLVEVGAARMGLRSFVGPTEGRVTVEDLLDELKADYKLRGGRSLPQFLAHLEAVRSHFGWMRAVTVTEREVDGYIERCLADGRWKPATINRRLEILARAFRLGVERRRIVAVPRVRSLPEKNVRKGFFEADEFGRFLAYLPEYLQDFVQFAYWSSWRRREIASLRWPDVDFKGRAVMLRGENAKTGRPRKFMLEGPVWALFERRRKARRFERSDGAIGASEFVFHIQGRPIGDFRKAWQTACRDAALPGKLFHDLRRTAIRNMVRLGVPEGVAMAISGHQTRAVFDRYNISSEDDLRQAVRAVTEGAR